MKIKKIIVVKKFVINDNIDEELFGALDNDILLVLDDKKGDVFRRVKLINCFPTEQIQAMQLDYGNGNTPYKVSMSFRCDYFEDVFN